MFHVYGGRCLWRKAIHSWIEKFSQGRSKVADDESEVRKWLRQQRGGKKLLCSGFRRTSTAMGQLYHVGGGYIEKYEAVP
jgi:hypothetical protein